MAKIAISAHEVLYNGPQSPAYARVCCQREFVNDDGQTVVVADVNTQNYTKQVAVTNALGVSTIAAFSEANEIDSSVDINSVTISTYTLSLHTASGSLITILYSGLRIPRLPTSTTWAAIVLFNQAHPQSARHEYYDTLQVNALLATGQAVGSDTITGGVRLSKPAANPLIPIAAGINDPQVISTIGTVAVGGSGTISPAASNFEYETVRFTGVLTGNRTVNWPVTNARKSIMFWNDTTGDFDLYVKATPEATGSIIVRRGSQSILINDGTVAIDVTGAITRVPFYVVESDGVTPQTIDYGVFYAYNTDLGNCLYETWCMMFPGGGSGCYDWSDGYGAVHAMLRNPVNGNIQSGSIITGATNATPIVITTSAAHGYTDGALNGVIQGVLGNLAANGAAFFLDVLSATTFALYTDAGFTAPVAGTGAYTSGGVVARTTTDPRGIVTFGADDVPYFNQWACSATGLSDGAIVQYYDGVPVGSVPFPGKRLCLGPVHGAGRGLMIGSDHNNFKGRIASYRVFEGKNPYNAGLLGSQSNLAAYVPQTVFSGSAADSTDASGFSRSALLNNFSRPEQVITDQSPGGHPDGFTHPGQIRGVASGILFNQSSYPAPLYVIDSNAPNALGTIAVPQPAGKVYTPSAVPGGALVFDSIQRKNSTYAWDNFGGIGSTEGGSLGALAWIQPDVPFTLAGIKPFGILNEQFVVLSNGIEIFARVPIAQTNLDIRVSRKVSDLWGAGISTGIMFRYVNDTNYCFATTNGTTRANQVLYIGQVVAGAVTAWTGNGNACPAAWEVLRVLTKSDGTYQVFCDATSVVSNTNAQHAAGTGAGIAIHGAPPYGAGKLGAGLRMRYRNFTVFANP